MKAERPLRFSCLLCLGQPVQASLCAWWRLSAGLMIVCRSVSLLRMSRTCRAGRGRMKLMPQHDNPELGGILGYGGHSGHATSGRRLLTFQVMIRDVWTCGRVGHLPCHHALSEFFRIAAWTASKTATTYSFSTYGA